MNDVEYSIYLPKWALYTVPLPAILLFDGKSFINSNYRIENTCCQLFCTLWSFLTLFFYLQSNPKRFMRLTDTGYIATCFFIFNPAFFPIAFNIHMLIFIGYFIAILFCGMTDADYIYLPQVDNDFASKWSYVVHLLPICFYIYYMSKNRKNIQFTTSTFKYSVYWVLIWFVFIYIPWRIFTGDVIYSILGKETTIYMKIMIVIGVLIALYGSNHIGKYICKSCK